MAKPVAPAQPVIRHQATPSTPDTDANYISDDDDDALPDLDADYRSESDDEEDDMEDATIHPRARRSKRIMQQMLQDEREGLHPIASLAAREQAALPDLTI